jgi:hypothetical protein
MSNNKLSTGIEEIDKIFQGGIPVGQFAFLYASNELDDIRTFTFPKNRDNKISLSLKFNPEDMELIKKLEEDYEANKSIKNDEIKIIDDSSPISFNNTKDNFYNMDVLQNKIRIKAEELLQDKINIIKEALKEALEYKLESFKLEDLKGRGSFVSFQNDLFKEYFCLDGENLLIIENRDNIIAPLKITKLYGKSK